MSNNDLDELTRRGLVEYVKDSHYVGYRVAVNCMTNKPTAIIIQFDDSYVMPEIAYKIEKNPKHEIGIVLSGFKKMDLLRQVVLAKRFINELRSSNA